MATARAWADAFLEQGREDLETLLAAHNSGSASVSTTAMLLQMVLEKLAKAAFLKMGTQTVAAVNRSHSVAPHLIVTFTKYSHLLPALAKAAGFGAASWTAVQPLSTHHGTLFP